jgi:hypothetical protein
LPIGIAIALNQSDDRKGKFPPRIRKTTFIRNAKRPCFSVVTAQEGQCLRA